MSQSLNDKLCTIEIQIHLCSSCLEVKRHSGKIGMDFSFLMFELVVVLFIDVGYKFLVCVYCV